MLRQQNHGIKTSQRLLFLLIAVVFLFYAASRAYFISFTHDESYTFYHYIRNSLKNIVLNIGTDPNNHILNSVFGQFCYYFIGEKPWMLRLPSVLLFAVFAWYNYKIHIKPFWLAFSGFLLVFCNPYLLDFFSLLRGYAGGLTFVLISLFFAKQLTENFKSVTLWKACLAAAVSTLFHICFLNFMLALLAAFFLLLVWRNFLSLEKPLKPIRSFLTGLLPLIISFAIVVVLVLPTALKFHKTGELHFAGSSGFWDDVAGTLIYYSLYDLYVPYREIIFGSVFLFVVLILLCASIFLVHAIWKKKFRFDFYSLLTITVLSASLGIWLQYFLFKINYPVDRLASFYLPLFTLLITFTFIKLRSVSIYVSYLLPVISLLLFAHTIRAFNLSSTKNWKYDAATPQMLKDVAELQEESNAKNPASIATSWVSEPVINFYRLTQNATYIYNANRNGFWFGADYIYAFDVDTASLKNIKKQLLRTYNYSNSFLYKNLTQTDTIYSASWQPTKIETYKADSNYITIFEFERNALADSGRNVMFSVLLKIKVPNTRAKAEIAASIINQNPDTMYLWQSSALHTAVPKANEWADAQFIFPLKGIFPSDKISVIIRNYGNYAIAIKDLRVYGLVEKK